ncbi:MAG: hypothetical protein R6X22_10815 [Gemmatimonadota bacterium]
MLSSFAAPALALISALTAGMPQDAQGILMTAREMKVGREAAVQNYTVDQRSAGSRHLLYYERAPGTDVFRIVPPDELAAEESGYTQEEAALMASGMATGLRMLGPALASEMGPGAAALGIDGMMADMAYFLDEAAAASRETDDPTAEAMQDEFEMAAFAAAARYVGRESVDGREAFLLRAEGGTVQAFAQSTPEGGTFTPKTVSLWIDTQYYVPLRLRVEGTMSDGARTSPITIEKIDSGYEFFGGMGGGVLLPKLQTMRIDGLTGAGMTEKERAEMEKAQAELAKAKAELDKLPKEQKDMIMSRMGKQFEQLESMASGGAIEATIEILNVKVNEGPPDVEDYAEVIGQ